MAFGIDDALMTAAAGISLTDTIVKTIKGYQKQKLDYDFEMLIGEVKTTTLRRIDDADLALTRFERMLVDRKTDLNQRISDIIAHTPAWRPVESHVLKQIQKQFNQFSDSIYSAGDDIAALARCRENTKEIGQAVVESTKAKHELHARLIASKSMKEAIEILRSRLSEYKVTLSTI